MIKVKKVRAETAKALEERIPSKVRTTIERGLRLAAKEGCRKVTFPRPDPEHAARVGHWLNLQGFQVVGTVEGLEVSW
jgi:hypothetical protein